ncbi:MAG: hypothetical protein HC933_01620 [Pleurocapsa sp. SU_196_0]|nr:hypothetical protein [Pleurocapsa sp. SU_196_0]
MGKLKVSAEQLFAFTRTLERKKMATIARKKPFRVKVLEGEGTQLLIFTPLSSKKPRRQQWHHFLSVVEKFNNASRDVGSGCLYVM